QRPCLFPRPPEARVTFVLAKVTKTAGAEVLDLRTSLYSGCQALARGGAGRAITRTSLCSNNCACSRLPRRPACCAHGAPQSRPSWPAKSTRFRFVAFGIKKLREKNRGTSPGFYCGVRKASDHVLEVLQRQDLDDLAGRLGLEHHLLAGERVDSLAR